MLEFMQVVMRITPHTPRNLSCACPVGSWTSPIWMRYQMRMRGRRWAGRHVRGSSRSSATVRRMAAGVDDGLAGRTR